MHITTILYHERRDARRYRLRLRLCGKASAACRARWAGLQAWHEKEAKRWEGKQCHATND
jgi:hypothetical protein